jgi:hypothetical protein
MPETTLSPGTKYSEKCSKTKQITMPIPSQVVGKQWFCRYNAALFLAHGEAKLS